MTNTAEKRAKLFMNGRSQAVRLPKEFRFEGTEVRIRKLGNGVVLEPVGAPSGSVRSGEGAHDDVYAGAAGA